MRKRGNISYICQRFKAKEEHNEGYSRDITGILGVRGVPAAAGGDYQGGDGRTRHAGADADGGREVADVPGERPGAGGTDAGGDAAHRADEGPGGGPAATGRGGGGAVHGDEDGGYRVGDEQVRVRRGTIPVRVAGAADVGPFPGTAAADAGAAHRGGRGTLHLAMGIRFPPVVPANSGGAGVFPGRGGSGPDGNGYPGSGGGYSAATGIRSTERAVEEFPAGEYLVRDAGDGHERRGAGAHPGAGERVGHRVHEDEGEGEGDGGDDEQAG